MDTTSSTDLIQVSTQGRIKTITLCNPKRKNAISAPMAYLLLEHIREARDDDSRVVILTGEGRDFCAGADLDPSLVNGQGFDVTAFLRETYAPLVTEMRNMNKPFIAKVRGNCVGVGFNFAMACDLIYASEDARFSQIFTKIGLSSDGGGAYFMLERLGYHRAFELMATHAMLKAPEAEQMGLINTCVIEDVLDETVSEMANNLADGPYLAIQHTKANLRAAQQGGLQAALESEAINQGKNFQSKDFLEGIMAFLQKRPARFQGH
jgi:2-(1,2-epoxy-1,2-dihydrophenyl)acetyl-CoA isomerase